MVKEWFQMHVIKQDAKLFFMEMIMVLQYVSIDTVVMDGIQP